MNQAREYITNPNNPSSVYVEYKGEKRKLFRNQDGTIGILAKGKRKYGYEFDDFNSISKIYYPKVVTEETKTEYRRKMVQKFKKFAAKATFTNPFIRKCLEADQCKSLYENGLSTGSCNEGKIVSLQSIAKVNTNEVEFFVNALMQKKEYNSGRFLFRGYECTLSVGIHKDENNYTTAGDVMGYLSMEYKDCLNGYYYLLINEENFIGYDKD